MGSRFINIFSLIVFAVLFYSCNQNRQLNLNEVEQSDVLANYNCKFSVSKYEDEIIKQLFTSLYDTLCFLKGIYSIDNQNAFYKAYHDTLVEPWTQIEGEPESYISLIMKNDTFYFENCPKSLDLPDTINSEKNRIINSSEIPPWVYNAHAGSSRNVLMIHISRIGINRTESKWAFQVLFGIPFYSVTFYSVYVMRINGQWEIIEIEQNSN